MRQKGSDVDKQSADGRDDAATPLDNVAIIQFGILCCAVTIMIVFAVAIAAS
jgi:hypothetical protein